MNSNRDDLQAAEGQVADSKSSRMKDGERSSEGRSRRSFLKSTALASAVPATVLAGTASSTETDYSGTLPFQNDPHWVRFHVQNIINNENTHLEALLAELGPNARPKPTFQNLQPANLKQFVVMGSTFCSVGAGAYLGAAPYLQNPYLITQAGSLGQVELSQSAYLNSLLDLPFIPNGSAFAPALTLSQVLGMASPFIASLNGGPPIAFSTTQLSLENDIAILNAALVLEYLEHEFYNTYFPRFFS